MVRKMIARHAENKVVGWEIEKNVYHNSAIGPADCVPVLQDIVPIDSTGGNTANQRMGDKVSPKSLTVKGFVSFGPSTANTAQPIYVRILILSQKNIKVGTQVQGGAVDTDRLLRPGLAGVGSDQVAFDGQTQTALYPINKDLFRVYMDKTIKLSSGLVTGGSVEQMPLYTARYSYTFKKLPSTLSYDEGNGDWANNFAPFIAIGYSYGDGTSPDVISSRVVHNCFAQLQFEDA